MVYTNQYLYVFMRFISHSFFKAHKLPPSPYGQISFKNRKISKWILALLGSFKRSEGSKEYFALILILIIKVPREVALHSEGTMYCASLIGFVGLDLRALIAA